MFFAAVTSTPAGFALHGAVPAAHASAAFRSPVTLSPLADASVAAHADGARS
ncbi:hypothetical protein [Actinomadura alba]|uniref:Uncharacterized protein n=1 Tax=Actinomadura alba TaxID=406431 RepID=A0ABR7LUF0_9ACTN|nr:hypothetical protein [Actinomadura alba]MBC6468466.1 hypothetical protein [Actinomadura alba]